MSTQESPLILIVDDEAPIRTTLEALLGGEGYRVECAASVKEALARLSRGSAPDVALLDVFLPDGTGLDLLSSLRELQPALPAIMISGQGDIAIAVEATRRGAFDFLEKPLGSERLLLSIRHALDIRALTDENRALRESRGPERELVAESAPMVTLLEQAALVAPRRVPVLITGESGVGKEHIARILHERGPYRGGPFVALNAAAVPRELMESTLFGHEKGAFTGAVARHRGVLEQAHEGTLFLDEIGEMSVELQARLLRVIEEKQVRRIGGEAEIPAAPRIVAATNRDLPSDIAAGRFRGDLYHRLAVVVLAVPPLRERRADIAPLAEYFARSFCIDEHLPPRRLAPEALALLAAQPWPGNVRELRNVVERGLILSRRDPLTVEDLARVLGDPVGEVAEESSPAATPDEDHYTLDLPSEASLEEALRIAERRHLEAALEAEGWNVTRAAARLGLDRAHCHRKIRAHGLRRPSPDA